MRILAVKLVEFGSGKEGFAFVLVRSVYRFVVERRMYKFVFGWRINRCELGAEVGAAAA